MKHLLFLSIFFIFLVFEGNAQGVVVKEDPAISSLVNRFIEINRSKGFIEGWRIQILATTDRRRMESAKQNFQFRYPNITVDWVHAKPYYKLRAGAFSTRLEAFRLLHILKKDYPGAYQIQDKKVRPQELIDIY
ncbi:MAG: SPOR domain-containing protein [Bacteroidetes bacterium]|nr:SPOR domain-containing protein [Bacteroidota bacterium]